jgi:L-lactate dehydrogenase complex protein LldF
MSQHAQKAAAFIRDEARTDWHDQALWFVRSKRDKAAATLPEWEQLRALASGIKDHVLSNLDVLLEKFSDQASANGVKVHWASDASEHNAIVLNILQQHRIRKLVKSKSMLTEECGLNPFLEARGVEVIDTDLGERIIQMREEPPSHIVLPAIHLKKEEVGELFHEKLGTPEGLSDPTALTEAARHHLRTYFLEGAAALTGVNFGIAETGGVVVCTNEGNADMGVHGARLQIHSMGIEKIIPGATDLGVFIRLLARSGTGQPSTVYTAHYHSPRPGTEMHIIVVDNGRTEQLGREDFRNSLKCIRCGACMNTCPIYRRSGGHSYDTTIPGPIGSILTPGIDLKKHADLPFASTLCGSCSDVCPVKINIHEQLYRWRQVIAEAGLLPPSKKMGMKAAAAIFARPDWYRNSGRIARAALRLLPDWAVYNRMNEWGKDRELPEAPAQGFRDWYLKNKKP